MISVVVLTHNEAINIRRCLASVAWSDDVLVIDSGSTDGTQDLAAGMGARVKYRPFDNFANQRNYALDEGALRHRWVLHVDADEEVTPELRDEAQAIARAVNGLAGYRVPSRLMLMGQWLKHSGMYPTYQVRFGTREGLRFQMVGHGQREMLAPGEVGTLRGDLIHHNFSKGISDWLAKHARYARDEAIASLKDGRTHRWGDLLRASDKVERRRTLKALSQRLPMRPLARFLYVYLLRRGFLDGRAGFRYAMLMATYQWAIDMNLAEQRSRQTEPRN
jgi:glycosyltransferase involved in cell wall biosynthesis